MNLRTTGFAVTVLCTAVPFWPGAGRQTSDRCRVVVSVAAVDIGSRPHDERPADFRMAARDFTADRRIDLASLQVVRWDPETSAAVSGPLPLRWYDDAIPYDFPECEQ